ANWTHGHPRPACHRSACHLCRHRHTSQSAASPGFLRLRVRGELVARTTTSPAGRLFSLQLTPLVQNVKVIVDLYTGRQKLGERPDDSGLIEIPFGIIIFTDNKDTRVMAPPNHQKIME